MSADNGVYILKMKDQYRVSCFGAADNLFYFRSSGHMDCLQPLRIVEYYKDAQQADNAEKALSIALNLKERLPVCEYGIQIISVDKTWEEIRIEAGKDVQKEMETIPGSSYHTKER